MPEDEDTMAYSVEEYKGTDVAPKEGRSAPMPEVRAENRSISKRRRKRKKKVVN